MKYSMSRPSKLLSRIIPIFALAIIVSLYFFIDSSTTQEHPFVIIDGDVPLASLTDAYYFITHENVSLDDVSTFTEDMFDYIGNGSVLYTTDIYNDSSAVQNAIVTVPTTSDSIQSIEWNYMVKYESYVIVAGIYADDNRNMVNAEFYLYNPQHESVFTNVTPDMAEYIGNGQLCFSGDIYNQVDSVWAQVIKEPDYFSPDGEYIEWGSAYKYNDKYVVIGKYVKGEKPEIGNSMSDMNASMSDFIAYDDENSIESQAFDYELAPAGLEFDTLSDLIKTDISAGNTVFTRGFYFENDGGGATYSIEEKASKTDNMFTFKLDNGLFATLVVEDDTICVDQLGAYGDGESDDVTFIQKALDSGYNVTLGENKNYKIISNGLYFRSNKEFDGKNSHIIVDDSYAPTNGDFNKYLLRCKYEKELDSLTIKNLVIDATFNEHRFSGNDYFAILQPRFVKIISLDSIIMNIDGNDNDINAFWMNNGCDQLSITNSEFILNSTGVGGIIFLNSKDDNQFHYYEAFKNIEITNCRFKGVCADEAIAIYGPNDVKATFRDCKIDWKRESSAGSSRPIAIWTKDYGVNYDIEFIGCEIIADSKHADSAIGVGSLHPQNIKAHFEDCKIYANVKNCLVYFQLLPSNSSNVQEYDYNNDKYEVSFDHCDIICNKTILGSSNFYNGTSGKVWAIDSDFNNCNIDCAYCFAYVERSSTSQYYYVPQIEIDNCNINISDAIGFIYKSNYSPEADIDISDTNVYADGITTITSYRYNTNIGSCTTQTNVSETSTSISNTYINNKLTQK